MSIGKYSPTVSAFYAADENWFYNNCETENDIYDRDGYDRYGYDENGIDRAGHDEYFYLYKSDEENDLLDEDYIDERRRD